MLTKKCDNSVAIMIDGSPGYIYMLLFYLNT